MRRSIVLSVILGALMLSGGGAEASKRWVSKAPYETPALGGCVDAGGHNACGYYMDCSSSTGCARVILKRSVAAVKVQVIDDSGQPTAARIYAPGAGYIGAICGKTSEPFFINGAAELWVHVHNGTCFDSTPSVATQGVVRVRPA
jgi:hypothetical protein